MRKLTALFLIVLSFTLMLQADDYDLPEEYKNKNSKEEVDTADEYGRYPPPEGYEYEDVPIEEFLNEEQPLVQEKSANQKLKLATDKSSDKDNPNLALALLEGGPSSIVGGCVNAVTGAYFDSETDLVINGAQPLTVQRSYSSLNKRWNFQYMHQLNVGMSPSRRHLRASYQDGTGSGMPYCESLDNFDSHPLKEVRTIEYDREVLKNGLTNWGSGEISGQTNWKNSRISFVRLGEVKCYLLRTGSHLDRLFVRSKYVGGRHQGAPEGEFKIISEINPNGNRLKFSYEDKKLKKSKLSIQKKRP